MIWYPLVMLIFKFREFRCDFSPLWCYSQLETLLLLFPSLLQLESHFQATHFYPKIAFSFFFSSTHSARNKSRAINGTFLTSFSIRRDFLPCCLRRSFHIIRPIISAFAWTFKQNITWLRAQSALWPGRTLVNPPTNTHLETISTLRLFIWTLFKLGFKWGTFL